jgi:hypothetical protein
MGAGGAVVTTKLCSRSPGRSPDFPKGLGSARLYNLAANVQVRRPERRLLGRARHPIGRVVLHHATWSQKRITRRIWHPRWRWWERAALSPSRP